MTGRVVGAAAALLLAGLCLLTAPPTARAYVRTLSSHGNPVSWRGSCIFLTPDAWGSTQVAGDAELAALEAAVATWNAVACSYMQFRIDAPEANRQREFDKTGKNQNVVVFLEDHWPHDPGAVALTTLTLTRSPDNAVDGEILDTDLELNGYDFTFGVNGEGDRHDLQAILTHELGHMLGLDHTCDDGQVDPPPVDHLGNQIPWCQPLNNLPDDVIQATMFNFAEPGELDKRSLEPDDEAGACAIYPLGSDPGRCDRVDLSPENCNCGSGPGSSLPLWPPMLLLVALWLRRRGR